MVRGIYVFLSKLAIHQVVYIYNVYHICRHRMENQTNIFTTCHSYYFYGEGMALKICLSALSIFQDDNILLTIMSSHNVTQQSSYKPHF